MDMPDSRLFDFDTNAIHWNQKASDEALRDYPEIYRNHLAIAIAIADWESNLDEDDRDFRKALRDVAAHLRQADFVPNGVLMPTS